MNEPPGQPAEVAVEPNGPNQIVSNVFILNNTIGAGRLFFIASHGKGPVNNIVVSGNRLHQHVLSIDVVPATDAAVFAAWVTFPALVVVTLRLPPATLTLPSCTAPL